MDGGFGDDVGVEAVAEVDRVNVVTEREEVRRLAGFSDERSISNRVLGRLGRTIRFQEGLTTRDRCT